MDGFCGLPVWVRMQVCARFARLHDYFSAFINRGRNAVDSPAHSPVLRNLLLITAVCSQHVSSHTPCVVLPLIEHSCRPLHLNNRIPADQAHCLSEGPLDAAGKSRIIADRI